jgi:hypothetical protein
MLRFSPTNPGDQAPTAGSSFCSPFCSLVRYHNLLLAARLAVFPGFFDAMSRTVAFYAHETDADDADADHVR